MTKKPNMPVTANNSPSLVRVSFSQTKGDGVTASLRHSIGPLVVGEQVVAYEVDEPHLWAWALVAEFDRESEVALLNVDWSSMREVDQSAVDGFLAFDDQMPVAAAVEEAVGDEVRKELQPAA